MPQRPNITIPWVYTKGVSVTNWAPETPNTTIDIYVNSTTGADTNSGASPTDAYLTIMAAIEANFFALSDGITVRLNLAGAADHTIAEDYTFPAIISSDPIATVTSTYGFSKRGTLVIESTPTLSATVAIVSQANNSISGQKEITCAGLTATALNGKFGVDANNTLFRVRNNTTTLMRLNYAGDDLVSPLRIYTEGAIVAPEDPSSAVPTITLLAGTAPLILNGVSVESSTGGGVQVGPGQSLMAYGSTIADLALGTEYNTNFQGNAQVEVHGCQLTNFNAPAGHLYIENCNISAGTIAGTTAALSVIAAASSFNSMTTPVFGQVTALADTVGSFLGTNLFITTGTTFNVWQSGGKMTLDTCDIAACSQIGVRVENDAFVKLLTCGSSVTNGTFGISVFTGGKVQVNSGTLITGTTADITVDPLTAVSFATFRLGGGALKLQSLATGSQIYQDSASTRGLPQTSVITTAIDVQLTNENEFVTVDTSGGSRTVTLPLAATMDGRKITVFKLVAGNSMIIEGNGAETINGAANKTTATQFGTLTMISDGTTWWITSTFGTIT